MKETRLPKTTLIRYVGNKTRSAPMIAKHIDMLAKNLPIKKYAEPFCGSAAMFLQMHREGLIGENTETVLADKNPHTIKMLTDVRDRPKAVAKQYAAMIEEASAISKKDFAAFFKTQLKKMNTTNNAVAAAVYMFVCNNSYRGYVAVRSKGWYAVPGEISKTKGSPSEIAAWSRLLQNTQIVCGDAMDSTYKADCIYIDPPYYKKIINKDYLGTTFDDDMTRACFNYARLCASRGAFTVMSNAPECKSAFDHRSDHMRDLSVPNMMSRKESRASTETIYIWEPR